MRLELPMSLRGTLDMHILSRLHNLAPLPTARCALHLNSARLPAKHPIPRQKQKTFQGLATLFSQSKNQMKLSIWFSLWPERLHCQWTGQAFATISPPIDWLNPWLDSNAQSSVSKYMPMDSDWDLRRSHAIHECVSNLGYQVQRMRPKSFHQNGPGECPLCHVYLGKSMPKFRPYAFYRYRLR